jgi:hypothetical protein
MAFIFYYSDTNICSKIFIFAIIKHPMKVIFMKPKKASLSVISGIFKDTKAFEWIGPSLFDVWGMPKVKKLRGVCAEERRSIFSVAEKIYAENS